MSENTDQHRETTPSVAWGQAEFCKFCTGPVLAVDMKADLAGLWAAQRHQLTQTYGDLVIASPRQGKSGWFRRQSGAATGLAGEVIR